jgi:hypothetical protein
MRSEERLWRAVIARAFSDACLPFLNDEAAERQVIRSEARAWLTRPSRNLTIICTLAGEEPSRVQALAKKLIAEADAGSTRRISAKAFAPAPAPRRKAAVYTFDGKTMTLVEWSKQTGINAGTLKSRLDKGWSVEEALTTPRLGRSEAITRARAKSGLPKPRPPKATTGKRGKEHLLEFRGECHSITEWSHITGINHRTIRSRLAKGWPVDRVLSEAAANVGRGVVANFPEGGGDRSGVLNARSDLNSVFEEAE